MDLDKTVTLFRDDSSKGPNEHNVRVVLCIESCVTDYVHYDLHHTDKIEAIK